MLNDKTYFTHENFESNPSSTENTAKFHCLDLSGQGVYALLASFLYSERKNLSLKSTAKGICLLRAVESQL